MTGQKEEKKEKEKEKKEGKKEEKKFVHTDGREGGPIKGSTRGPRRPKKALLWSFVLQKQFFSTPEIMSKETIRGLRKSEA